MDRLKAWALIERSAGFKIVFVIAAVGLSFWLRLVLDGSLPAGFPYLTFFPAVVLTTFFAGTAAGFVAGVLCGLAAWYFFLPPAQSFALTPNAALALGFYVLIVGTEIVLIHVMNRALREQSAATARADALARTNTLMFQELQHRVSNNLQVVSSLLKVQRRAITDPAAIAALDAAANRLEVVARIQRSLHDPTRQDVDLSQFLAEVGPQIITATAVGQAARLEVDAEAITVTAERAVPLALICAELIANALEHGTDGVHAQDITVSARTDGDGRAHVEVRDNGPGLPAGFDLDRAQSLGLKIARQFTLQLGGKLTMTSDRGTVARIEFPLQAA